MRRVCVVITARPSYSRIRSALTDLKHRPDVELQIIAAASALVTRYGRIVDQIRADGFQVTEEVSSVVDGDTLADTVLSTGLLLTGLGNAFARLKPHMVVTIADRHETLATAIAASYQQIPLCHVQGGEVTGSIDDKVRNAVTQLSDVHCVASNDAAMRVNRMRPGTDIHVTGCPSIDIAAEALHLGPLGDQGIVVLQHPVSGEDNTGAMGETVKALRGLRALYFWPGEDAGNEGMCKVLRLEGIRPVRNIAPVDFLRTLLAADCLVGNSSVGIRECAYLGVPVVNIGTRQEGRQRADNVMDSPAQADFIRTAVGVQQSRHWFARSTMYGDGRAGERIAGVLAGDRREAAA